jgi:hypothetical protein
VYAGDDTTDFPALDLAARTPRGMAVFVVSPERHAPPVPGVWRTPGVAWRAALVRLARRVAPCSGRAAARGERDGQPPRPR